VSFVQRVQSLPFLGIGVSTEYGAGQGKGGLDPLTLHTDHPRFGSFLEVGVETAKGLDSDAIRWTEQGGRTTYHFLDINLDEAEDFDSQWLTEVRQIATQLNPAWMCGDAGLWHFGPRERGHMLLLPPVLCSSAARDMAMGIRRLRD